MEGLLSLKISTMGVKLDIGFLSLLLINIFLMFYFVLNEVHSITCYVSICLWPASDTDSCTVYTPCAVVLECMYLSISCACVKHFVFCRKKVLDFYQRTSLTAYCTAFAYRPLTRGVSSQLSQVYLELPADSKHLYVSNRSLTPLAWDFRNVLDPHCKSPLGHCHSVGACSCSEELFNFLFHLEYHISHRSTILLSPTLFLSSD